MPEIGGRHWTEVGLYDIVGRRQQLAKHSQYHVLASLLSLLLLVWHPMHQFLQLQEVLETSAIT
jgi:hypothetical protein